ncbi:uncharacterized [Tachysurus ichikawai]
MVSGTLGRSHIMVSGTLGRSHIMVSGTLGRSHIMVLKVAVMLLIRDEPKQIGAATFPWISSQRKKQELLKYLIIHGF